MVTIQTYLYAQIVEVQILDPTIFTTRNNKVYARPVTVYKGIDNPIQIRVKNQDQRAVDMSPQLMQVDIQDPIDQLTEYSLGVSWTNRLKGYGRFTITKTMLETLTKRQYKLTFRVINAETNEQQPAYIDDNFGVPLDLIVLPAYYSDMLPQEGEPSGNDFIKIDGGTI